MSKLAHSNDETMTKIAADRAADTRDECSAEPFEKLSDLLINVAQFMDAVKPDLGLEWSGHDQAVRDAVSRHLRRANS